MHAAIDWDMNVAKPKAKAGASDTGESLGPIIAENLIRLGCGETTVRLKYLSDLIRERTKKSMSRQRLSTILNAVRVTPETIETLAKALGVKPEELTRRSPKR